MKRQRLKPIAKPGSVKVMAHEVDLIHMSLNERLLLRDRVNRSIADTRNATTASGPMRNMSGNFKMLQEKLELVMTREYCLPTVDAAHTTDKGRQVLRQSIRSAEKQLNKHARTIMAMQNKRMRALGKKPFPDEITELQRNKYYLSMVRAAAECIIAENNPEWTVSYIRVLMVLAKQFNSAANRTVYGVALDGANVFDFALSLVKPPRSHDDLWAAESMSAPKEFTRGEIDNDVLMRDLLYG